MADLVDEQDTDSPALTIMAACDAFVDCLADVIVAESDDVDRAVIVDTIRPEVFMCAFDVVYAQWAGA